ncbi:chromosomal replication protein DnaA [Mycoplasma ovis str. Michigan]|uniref:Chromosomal replication protein DnaA n=1 Tax=Mycoplasma ovis str. Michigan TaxID=1415773 RepID=A0ABM5P0X2_9MOLU|nr:ATP-binding protein [Mycoplasma ovis]AHC40071.1 chromosomal replication protein DnaA [Mycoplasma ovis str. Michigan]
MSKVSNNSTLLSNLISYLDKKNKLTDYKHLLSKRNKLTLKKNYCILSLINSLHKKIKSSEKEIKDFLFSELNKNFNIFFEVLEDEAEIAFKNQLESDLKEFKTQSKFDFYIENKDNYLVINKLKEFLENSTTNSILLIGSKGSGKSYLVRELLRETEYVYLNLETFSEKLFRFKTNKKVFINYFSDFKLIVFDNLESINKNSDSYKLLQKIEISRKELGNKNIFIIGTEKFESKKTITNNLLVLPPPSQSFVLQLTKELLKRHHPDLKITESAIEFLSYLLGNNLKELINKLFKFLIFLDGYSYQTNILDKEELNNIFNNLFNKSEKKSLINYEQNSQLKALCDKKRFILDVIKSKSKTKKEVFERDQIIHILKEKFNFSIKDISLILSRSKSSIHYSLKKIKNKKESETFKNYFDYLTKI